MKNKLWKIKKRRELRNKEQGDRDKLGNRVEEGKEMEKRPRGSGERRAKWC